jgi:hypothetical protein
MRTYPVAEHLLGPILRVAMPRAVGSAVLLRGYLPPHGRPRVLSVPPRIPPSTSAG